MSDWNDIIAEDKDKEILQKIIDEYHLTTDDLDKLRKLIITIMGEKDSYE